MLSKENEFDPAELIEYDDFEDDWEDDFWDFDLDELIDNFEE